MTLNLSQLSTKNLDSKLSDLISIEGFVDELELLKESLLDSRTPSICINPSCSFTTYYEPDQSEGWCDSCEENTVVSALILMGI